MGAVIDLKPHEVLYRDWANDTTRITTATCHEDTCDWEVVVDDDCRKKGHTALLLGLGHQALKTAQGAE